MTFGTWLIKQTDRDDPVGDLARDFKQHVEMNAYRPSSVRTPGSMRRKLQRLGCCDGAERALDEAADEYQSRE